MKNKLFVKIGSIVLMIIMCIPMFIFGASASNDSAVFTRIDMSNLTYSKGGTDNWTLNEGILSQQAPSGSSFGDSLAMTDIYLEKGKAYTLELKLRFSDAFTSANSNSRGVGMVFGANQLKPWDAGGSAYSVMVDRASGTGKHIRVFGKNITTSVTNNIGRAFTADEKASTDWMTVRLTISETGVMTGYLNGVIVGQSSNESTTYNGGYIGVNTYGVRTKVEIKDFAIADGVTTAAAVYADEISEKHELTVKYVYSGNNQTAATDKVISVAEGEFYYIKSPTVGTSVPDKTIVSGFAKGENETITVTYQNGYKLTIKYLMPDGSSVFEDYVQENMLPGTTYSVQTYPIANYTADTMLVTGTMGNEDKVITVNFVPKTYKLTVKYVDEDGEEIHDAYVGEFAFDAEYKVESPAIEGMTPDKNEITGKNLKKDTTVTVTYSANETSNASESSENTADEQKSGCGSMIGATGALVAIGVVAGTCLFSARRKQDDE